MPFDAVPGLVETIEAHGETTLVVDPARLVEACTQLREDGFAFLSDISAADYLGWGERGVAGYIGTAGGRDLNATGSQGFARVPTPRPKRFSVSYHLLDLHGAARRVRVKVWLDEGEDVDSVVRIWPTADWHEREAWDLMGIRFRDHPNLVRILMEDDWEGHPLRKDYPVGGEPVRFSGDVSETGAIAGTVAIQGLSPRPPYEGSRIPSPIPTILQVDPERHDLEDILTVNFGPNHPSTHGVLRLVVDLDGEHVAGLAAVIGYLHTGFEKTMEQKTWWKCMTYPERIDYVSYINNGLVWVLAVEKLLGLEPPPKATWMRMCMAEINRLHSHLIWLGTSALEIGAISMLWYAFREREKTVELSELVGGTRMHTRYFQAGGLAEDLPPGFVPVARDFCKQMSKGIDDYERLLTANKIWLERTQGVGLLSPDDAIALGQSGPVLRASGVDWDLRRDDPYLTYAEVDFDVPVYHGGDVFDRYRVHMDEMRQSVRIIRQSLDRLEELAGEPWIADDRKVVLPPREELHTSMESLIHHFKIVTEGYLVPEGEVYVTIESPRGELGCYVVSDGGPKPWRVKFRAPSFVALQATATCMTDAAVADLIAIVGSLDSVMGEVDR